MAERPYSRVYWSILDDERFDTCRDPLSLGAWLLLLVTADAMYPASPLIPHGIPSGALRRLISAGLIEPLSGRRYRVHGLDAERGRRTEAAKAAAHARWMRAHNGADATAYAPALLDETRRDETSRAEQDTPHGLLVDEYLALRRRLPTERQRAILADYLDTFDETGAARGIAAMRSRPDDPLQALLDDLTAFRADRRAETAAAETEAKQRRKSQRSGLPAQTVELMRLMAEAEA